MKLIQWIFTATTRHRKEIFRYEKKGVRGRVGVLLVALLFTALSFGIEFFFLHNLYHPGSDLLENFFILFGIGILGTAVWLATLDYTSCFSYVGFRMAIVGVVFKAATLADMLRKKKISEEEAATAPEENGHRGLDLFVGIFLLLLTIAIAVCFIGLLVWYPMYFVK